MALEFKPVPKKKIIDQVQHYDSGSVDLYRVHRYDILRVVVPDLKEWSLLSFLGLLRIHEIRYLYVRRMSPVGYDEICFAIP